LVNEGGQIVAYGNMALNAAEISGTAHFIPSIAVRPPGLNSFFVGPNGWSYSQPVGGLFMTPTGSIAVTSGQAITLDGGDLLASAGVTNSASINRIAPASPVLQVGNRHIGLLRGWF
jgi:hypothetical protein